ncbi:MAG: AgmX/PglI C-terminal domain-containing protein, partial [Myxococcota bacterium]
MRFACEHCHAPYEIDDHKIGNKVLRIRCKRCQHIMLVSKKKASSSQPQVLRSNSPSSAHFTFSEQDYHAEKTITATIHQDVLQELQGPDQTDPALWFFSTGSAPIGPLTHAALGQKIRSQIVYKDHFVWHAGWKHWKVIEDVEELQPFFPPATTETPPPSSSVSAENQTSAEDNADQEVLLGQGKIDPLAHPPSGQFDALSDEFFAQYTTPPPESKSDIEEIEPPVLDALSASSEEAAFFQQSWSHPQNMESGIFALEIPMLPPSSSEHIEQEPALSLDDEDILEQIEEFKTRSGLFWLGATVLVAVVLILLSVLWVSPKIRVLTGNTRTDEQIDSVDAGRAPELSAQQCQLLGLHCPTTTQRRRRRIRRTPSSSSKHKKIPPNSDPSQTPQTTSALDDQIPTGGSLPIPIPTTPIPRTLPKLPTSEIKTPGNTPQPRVRQSNVPSGLMKKLVRALTRHQRAVKSCYELFLKQQTVQGRLQLFVWVSPKGHVLRVKAKRKGVLRRSPLERCVIRRAKRWHFPSFTGEPVRL